MEINMRAKLMAGAAALALSACTILASAAPASAQRWGGWHGGWHGGWGFGGAVAAGVIGGAVAAATSPFWAPGYYDYYGGYPYSPYGYNTYYAPPPAVAVAPGPVVAQNGDDVAWCQSRYRSYNPSTGTFLGYDGQNHPCP
jgi:hypothetical protein